MLIYIYIYIYIHMCVYVHMCFTTTAWGHCGKQFRPSCVPLACAGSVGPEDWGASEELAWYR